MKQIDNRFSKKLNITVLLSFFLFSSCSLLKNHTVDRELFDSTKKICLSSHGKGRLVVQNKKYVFAYDSALDDKHSTWILALNFPLRNVETFKLDWSQDGKVKFISSIEDKLLKENDDVNPKSLEEFTQSLGNLLNNIIQLRSTREMVSKEFNWKRESKSLTAISENKRFKAVFTNLVGDKYFGLVRLSYQGNAEQTYKLDLVVRKCIN